MISHKVLEYTNAIEQFTVITYLRFSDFDVPFSLLLVKFAFVVPDWWTSSLKLDKIISLLE